MDTRKAKLLAVPGEYAWGRIGTAELVERVQPLLRNGETTVEEIAALSALRPTEVRDRLKYLEHHEVRASVAATRLSRASILAATRHP